MFKNLWLLAIISVLCSIVVIILPGRLGANHLAQDFRDLQRKTEFLDDDTEDFISSHKLFFGLAGVAFIWVCYLSLSRDKQ